MKGKIHTINIIILAVYMIFLTIAAKGDVLLAAVVPITVHILINVVLFFIYLSKDKPLAYTYLLSALVVLLIGFPSCWGLSNMAGGMRI